MNKEFTTEVQNAYSDKFLLLKNGADLTSLNIVMLRLV